MQYPYPLLTPIAYPFPEKAPIAYPLPYPCRREQITSSPTNDLSDILRPNLKQIALTIDDIPFSSDSLYSYFINPEITSKDNSRDLLGLCEINCVKKIWTDILQRRSLVIVMYQVSDASQAKKRVEESFTNEIRSFGSNLVTGTIDLPELPSHSWITSSKRVKGFVGDLITFQTSWGSIVVILSEQGDITLHNMPLDEYFLTMQRLANLQLEKLKRVGYNKQ